MLALRLFVIYVTVLYARTGHACHQSGWSRWINNYKPSRVLFPEEAKEGVNDGGGDVENMNQTERDSFCAPGHGTISKIECETADGRRYDTTGQQHLVCTVGDGFKCSNRRASSFCLDYKIRLFCQCTNPLPSTTVIASTTVKKGSIATSSGQASSSGFVATSPHISMQPLSNRTDVFDSKTTTIQKPDPSCNIPGIQATETAPTAGKSATVRAGKQNHGIGNHRGNGGNKAGHAAAAGITVLYCIFLWFI